MIHQILKNFKGSQDGRFTESFEAGTHVDLSDYLAEIVVREGWAMPVGTAIENKAIVTDGAHRRSKKHVAAPETK